jgi:hypothetical protein
MGTSYSNLGNLETDRGGSAGQAILWHVQAPEIRLRLGVPQAVSNLRRVMAIRSELGPDHFGALPARAAASTSLAADAVTSLLDQLADGSGGE